MVDRVQEVELGPFFEPSVRSHSLTSSGDESSFYDEADGDRNDFKTEQNNGLPRSHTILAHENFQEYTRSAAEDRDDVLRALFGFYDAQHKGFITPANVHDLIEHLCESQYMTEEEAKLRIELLPPDDAEVSLEELMRLFSRTPPKVESRSLEADAEAEPSEAPDAGPSHSAGAKESDDHVERDPLFGMRGRRMKPLKSSEPEIDTDFYNSSEFKRQWAGFPEELVPKLLICLLQTSLELRPSVSSTSASSLQRIPSHLLLDLSHLEKEQADSLVEKKLAPALWALFGHKLSCGLHKCESSTTQADFYRANDRYVFYSRGAESKNNGKGAGSKRTHRVDDGRAMPLMANICILHDIHKLSSSSIAFLQQAMHSGQFQTHQANVHGGRGDKAHTHRFASGGFNKLPDVQCIIGTYRSEAHMSSTVLVHRALPFYFMDEFLLVVPIMPKDLLPFSWQITQFFIMRDKRGSDGTSYTEAEAEECASGRQPHVDMDTLKKLRTLVEKVYVSFAMQQYMRDIIVCLRQHVSVMMGPSPSAAAALQVVARLYAVKDGVDFLRPSDVDAAAMSVLSHRSTMRRVQDSAWHVVEQVVSKVLTPPK